MVRVHFNTFVKTDIKIKNNRQNLIVIGKKKKKILIMEISIISLENLQQTEAEKSIENTISLRTKLHYYTSLNK